MGSMSTEDRPVLNTEDVIDVRDVIARVEYLRDALEAYAGDEYDDGDRLDDEEAQELVTLEALLDDLRGNGGDEQWQGDWFPVTLVRDTYFVDYARELADDIGAVPSEYTWPTSCIDWDRAARELRMDYTSTEFDGVTYWYR